MMISEAVPLEDQGEFVPQFATSPVALEMHPDEIAEQSDEEPERE